MKIYKSVTELIGGTPLLELRNIEKDYNLSAKIIAKLEFFNPAGSIKDRVAKAMIENAEERGLINNDSVIIEPTSGNTGIGLASVATSKGYKVIFTMPETMSIERRKLLMAYGAEIVLTDGKKGMKGAIDKAEELAKEIKNSYIPSQFTNKSNPEIHKKTTGKEIWEDTEGLVDILVAGVGTGGTISGCGEYLKFKNPEIKVIAVEPYNSPVISEGKAGAHGIQGIGAGFIPETFNKNIYDEVVKVKEEDAYKIGRELAKKEGILVGISAGAAVYTAIEIAKKVENYNKNIVVIIPDTGERYLSTPMFDE